MLRTENSPLQLAPHYALLQFETHDKRFMSMMICKSELFKSASNKYIAKSTGLHTWLGIKDNLMVGFTLVAYPVKERLGR
jgi:hypothetical protein